MGFVEVAIDNINVTRKEYFLTQLIILSHCHQEITRVSADYKVQSSVSEYFNFINDH